jgi:vacuolar-type H+-ATPase subunit E/Vma4
VSAAVATRALRRQRGSRGAVAPETASALRPVVHAIMSSSRSRADERIARAKSDARAAEVAARRDADGFVAQAAADATEAAERAAASRLAAARRAAHEIVLSTRSQVYEGLRDAALQALVARADSTEGRLLAQRIEELVFERIGDGATVHGAEGAASILSTAAESGHRRARLDATTLIDAVLETMPGEIEQLWT